MKTLPFIKVDCLTDDLLEYLITQKIAVDTLAHLSLPDKYLWMLTQYAEEALITLGKRYFISDNYSVEEFSSLLKQAPSTYWLWSSLLFVTTNNVYKRKTLIKSLFLLTDFADLKENVIEEITEGILSRTSRIDVIIKHYAIDKPRLLRGIAQNRFTPKDILIELSHVENVKFAKQIRQMSSDNLKTKLMTTDLE